MTSKISISETNELLLKAQSLLRDIEELLESTATTDTSKQRQQEHQTSPEQGVETLVIDGFGFESAASREDLRRLTSQADIRVTRD